MPEDVLRTSGPEVLSQLLRLGSHSYHFCDDRELAELLVHHLETPTEFEPAEDAPPGAARPTWSIAKILFDSSPSLPMLRQIKRYAKAHRNHPLSPLPVEIATALYLGSAAAALRLGQRISELEDAALRESFDWAIHQSWLTPPLRDLLRGGRDIVESCGGGGG